MTQEFAAKFRLHFPTKDKTMHIPAPGSRKENMMPMDSVHNYYERLVINEINEFYADKFDDADILADMACIALNRIEPRYIRYDIDMSFYMSTSEHIKVEKTVKKAVKKAYNRVQKFENEKLHAQLEGLEVLDED